MRAPYFFKLGNCFNISLCAHFCSPVPYRRRISAGNEGRGAPGRQRSHGEPWERGGGGAPQPRPAAPSCPDLGGARTYIQWFILYSVFNVRMVMNAWKCSPLIKLQSRDCNSFTHIKVSWQCLFFSHRTVSWQQFLLSTWQPRGSNPFFKMQLRDINTYLTHDSLVTAVTWQPRDSNSFLPHGSSWQQNLLSTLQSLERSHMTTSWQQHLLTTWQPASWRQFPHSTWKPGGSVTGKPSSVFATARTSR
jgi:hypothetical protein